MWEFDSWGVDLPAALALLAEAVGGSGVQPGVNCGGVFCPPGRPALPAGVHRVADWCRPRAAGVAGPAWAAQTAARGRTSFVSFRCTAELADGGYKGVECALPPPLHFPCIA